MTVREQTHSRWVRTYAARVTDCCAFALNGNRYYDKKMCLLLLRYVYTLSPHRRPLFPVSRFSKVQLGAISDLLLDAYVVCFVTLLLFTFVVNNSGKYKNVVFLKNNAVRYRVGANPQVECCVLTSTYCNWKALEICCLLDRKNHL